MSEQTNISELRQRLQARRQKDRQVLRQVKACLRLLAEGAPEADALGFALAEEIDRKSGKATSGKER